MLEAAEAEAEEMMMHNGDSDLDMSDMGGGDTMEYVLEYGYLIEKKNSF